MFNTPTAKNEFASFRFIDKHNQFISVQDSSLADPHIWIGVESRPTNLNEPQGLREIINARMHIDQGMAEKLIPLLQAFVDTGSIAGQ